MSKPVTAAGAMILMEQGKLDLAQPVEEILPGFKGLLAEENGVVRPAKKPLTSLHLLNMTSGLTYGEDDTKAGLMTGKYIEECEKRMFTEQAVTTEEFANHMGTIPPAFESGGAGLVSTIDDYARFAQMLLNGGSLNGVRVMSPRTVRFLTSGELLPDQQKAMDEWLGLEGYTYSHLMRRVRNTGRTSGLSLEGEYGWDGWLGCYFANFPEENMTILMMQQRKDSGTIPLTRKLRNVVLGEE